MASLGRLVKLLLLILCAADHQQQQPWQPWHLLPVEAGAPPKYRVDCAPGVGLLDEAACHARGCQWANASLPNQPTCFYKQQSSCYQLQQVPRHGPQSPCAPPEQWLLTRRPDCPNTGFPNEAEQLELRVSLHSDSVINVKLVEPNRWRNQARLPEIKRRSSKQEEECGVDESSEFAVQLSEDSHQLVISHRKTGTSLLELELAKLIYSEKFIQLTTYLPSGFLYGLGLQMGPTLLRSNVSEYLTSYTMFNYGHPPNQDLQASYSSYPFYINLVRLQNRQPDDPQFIAVGGFMHNANAMDVLHLNREWEEDYESAITWRPVGGIIDLYVFAGPLPSQVMQQYIRLVGQPTLPPAWALGYHQSRLNYRELMQIKLAWARTRDIGVPIETLWTDLDFMWRRTSYATSDPELSQFVELLHQQFDMHYVPLVDSTISVREDAQEYLPLKLAMTMDLFATYTRNESSTEMALVKQWTDSMYSAVLDVTSPHIVGYLSYILEHYHQQTNFDGLWLDMNEPEVFHNYAPGESDDENECSQDEQMPYLPGGRKLSDRTVCMSAQFHAGKHSDIHNLFAFYQTKAHYEALLKNRPHKRPFIISRSQYPGQARYGGTWLGDTGSSFEHLSWSLIGTIGSNWFGQPFVGADICGFFGPSSHELCARWFSLGSFYPFARNHNGHSLRDQDPGAMGAMVQRAAITTLTKRYSILPYLYTLFYENHLNAQPVIRSILFEFMDRFWRLPYPLDQLRICDLPQIDDQMMFGQALMVAPIVKADETSRKVYLAPGRWYDVSLGLPGTQMDQVGNFEFDFLKVNKPLVGEAAGNLSEDEQERLESLLKPFDCKLPLGCTLHTVYSPLGSTNLYLRGGTIVSSFRFVDSQKSVGQHWDQPIFLDVALDEKDEASGVLYLDNGESHPDENKYNLINLHVSNNRLEITLTKNGYPESVPQFQGFQVFGAPNITYPTTAMQNGVKLEFNHDSERMTFSCVFLKPEGSEIQHVGLVQNKTLIFQW